MKRQELMLIPSKTMDGNKKEGRNENGLVRMCKTTRDAMGFDSSVELYPKSTTTEDRLNKTLLLDIFHAFSEDIKQARLSGVSAEDMKRVGFVTTKTFNRIVGNKPAKSNIWISDGASDTVIGADPEFILFGEDGRIVKANTLIGKDGKIGNDGAMAEVRPDPAVTPEELVANIRVLFQNDGLVGKIKPYRWSAGCYFADENRDYPIGGHIHVGNPAKLTKIPMVERERFFKAMNKIMDELLSIPMIKIDGAPGKTRRTECRIGRYGYFGEFRTNNGHFEHRTLSGMWLMHPQLSEAVFGTAKAIIDTVYKNVAENKFNMDYMFNPTLNNASLWHNDFDRWAEIPIVRDMGCASSSANMISLLHNSDASKINKKFLQEWYTRMRNLSAYNTYSKHVDTLYEMLQIKTSMFHNHSQDLQKSWLEGREFLK